MQPWIQVIDYSLPGLTSHIILKIGISHVSISEIVVHGRCYTSHCFYFSAIFSWCFVGWSLFLFLVLCLLTVVWATNNAFLPVWFLSNWSLLWFYYIILQRIILLNCIIVDYFIYFVIIIYLVFICFYYSVSVLTFNLILVLL